MEPIAAYPVSCRLHKSHQMHGLAAAVLIMSPYSIMLGASAEGCVFVVDSHSHGPS